jgi:CO dehydrogenase/acetyl-CoA synthase gamma subunit (corrinoid Fe-S protein)
MPVIRTHKSEFAETTSTLIAADHHDHLLARLSFKREWHRVKPGLYRLGKPGPEAPVFVTSNYTLSFDALRSNLTSMDAFILVLDTFGVNVWCAAGKRTFDTKELVHRIQDTKLGEVVSHRILILPQLGAPGVAAHEVKKPPDSALNTVPSGRKIFPHT